MLTYSQFIDELRPLIERGGALRGLPRIHEDEGFRRWRHEVTDLVERIEDQSYSVNCQITQRLFDEQGSYTYDPSMRERIAAYNRDLQDTLTELETIVGRFEKFGDPKINTMDSAPRLRAPEKITTVWMSAQRPARILRYTAALLAVLVSVGTITTFGVTAYKWFTGPSVIAVLEIRDYPIHPSIRRSFEDKINTTELLAMIEKMEKGKKTPKEILNTVTNELKDEEMRRLRASLQLFGRWHLLHFYVLNTGSEVARDVRLVLPEKGNAQISDIGVFNAETKVFEWERIVPLGDIRPNAKTEVLVWPEAPVIDFDYLSPAIIHAGGMGRVLEGRLMYGWRTDLAYWYMNQRWTIQVMLVVVPLLFVAIGVYVAIRRGHIVFQPARHERQDQPRPNESIS